MNAREKKSSPIFLSDFKRIDAHIITDEEYEELPELDDDMLARGIVKKAGRPIATNPKKLISLRLAPEIIEKWKATGKGWQTRMAEKLGEV